MAEPVLFFCVGAQKAATSWLHAYLLSHPQTHVRRVKELHYFDSLGRADRTGFRAAHAAQLHELEDSLPQLSGAAAEETRAAIADYRAWLKVPLSEGEAGNFRPYLDFLTEGLGDGRLVADITPAYALLDEARFAQMRDLCPDTRFLFILRDPVDRAWSQIRFNARMQAGPAPAAVSARIAENLDRVLDGRFPGVTRRSDYRTTIERLLRVVPRPRLRFCFYEEMFAPAAIGGLCDFLGLDRMPARSDQPVNAGDPAPLPPQAARGLAERLRDQYSFCKDFFEGRLPERWHARMMEA